MDIFSFVQVKSHFSEFSNRVEKGQTILVTKHNKPSFYLIPVKQKKKVGRRKLGALEGMGSLSDDFDETSDHLIDSFYE